MIYWLIERTSELTIELIILTLQHYILAMHSCHTHLSTIVQQMISLYILENNIYIFFLNTF